MIQFLYGMNMMGFLVASSFFWRFWRKSADLFFLTFGAAFVLFALDQFFHAMEESTAGAGSWAFFVRLAGFGMLIVAILRKNLN